MTLLCILQPAYACCQYTNFFHESSYVEIDDAKYKSGDYSDPDRQFNLVIKSLNLIKQKSEETDNNDIHQFPLLPQKTEPDLYTHYREAANLYNQRNYKEALARFITLHDTIKNNKSWVKEASTYMIARSQRALSMEKWDGYTDPATIIDQAMLKNAKISYGNYLKEYPHGLYADSARNIQRNLMFLAGDREHLNLAIRQLISSETKQYDQSIINELHNFYTGEVNLKNDPLIFMIHDIIYHHNAHADAATILDQRKNEFSESPDAFRFLKALVLFHIKDYKGILNQVPEEPIINDPLSLSVAYLRYQAQIHLNQEDNALATLQKMYVVAPEEATLKHIASLKINFHHGLWLFSDKANIENREVLRAFAKYGLTDDELKSGLKESDISNENHLLLAEELASRYLLSKNYQGIDNLLMQYPNIKDYDSIKETIKALIYDKGNLQANLNIGVFIYENYLHANIKRHSSLEEYYGQLGELEECQPCQQFFERMKTYPAPLAYFKYVLNSMHLSSYLSESEACMLHYLVICKHEAEAKERCTWGQGGTDYDGKKYFNLLHNKHKNSIWVKITPYWYS